MKFIKQFATDELMNEAALQIHHKDGAFVYQSQSIKFIDENGNSRYIILVEKFYQNLYEKLKKIGLN